MCVVCASVYLLWCIINYEIFFINFLKQKPIEFCIEKKMSLLCIQWKRNKKKKTTENEEHNLSIIAKNKNNNNNNNNNGKNIDLTTTM